MKRALPSPRLPIARSKYESDLNRTLNSWFAQLTTNANDRAVGPAIASAATVSPSYPIHHITGSVAIATINVPSGSTGPIRLIADNGFSLATSGNIARAATLQVGEHIDLEYDPATSKWYTAHAPNTVDEVTDGSTYARTLSTYLASGVPYTFQGAWSNVTAYKKGDIVTSGGNTYLATANSTNSTPSTSNPNWQIFGSTGAGTLPSSGPLSDPTSLAFTITNKSDVLLTWAYPTALPADFAFFEIRKGATWASGTFVDTTAAFTYLITDVPPGTTTYWVGIKNLAGTYDATPPSIGVNVSNLPDVTNLTATITNKRDVKLAWNKVSPFKGFEGYEIRVGSSWASGALVDRTKKSSFVIVDPTPGTNTYWVGVRDKAGNYDANPPSVVATVGALPDVSVGSLTAYFTRKNDLDLRWTGVTRFPGFKGYDVYLGGVTISAISEVSSTVTVTTSSNHGFGIGDTVYITGVTPTGYNGAFVITGITSNTFTYTNSVTGLAAGSGGACIDLAVASLIASTRHNHYLVIDPAQGTNLYWIFVTDHAGNLDTFPPWISVTPTANQRGVPNKSILHLFPNAVMDVDGQRIDLPVVTPGTLATYLLSSGGEDFPIDVTAVVQGIVEFFFEAGGVDGNGYWFDFRGDTGAISMGKYVSGVVTTLASGTVPVSTTTARTLHIRMHSNGKFEFQVRNTKIVATDTTFGSLGNNVGVGTFAGGPGYISKCTIKGHSGIHPDNQDVNFKAVIDFSQPDGGGAHQHIGKNRDNINDTADLIRRTRLHSDHLIDNGNFENSTTNPPPGWQAGHESGYIGAATLSYDTTTPYAGSRSLHIVGPQFTGASQLKRVHVIPGEFYKLSAAMKINTAGSNGAISLFCVDKTGTLISQPCFIGTTSTTWSVQTSYGVIPANTAQAYILSAGQAAQTNDYEIDDVLLVRVRSLDTEVGDGQFIRKSWLGHHEQVVQNANFEASSPTNGTGPWGDGFYPQNGSTERTPPGWGALFGSTHPTLAWETAAPYEGTQSLKIIASVGGSGINSNAVAHILPGEVIKFGGAMFGDGTNAAQIKCTFWDKNFNNLQTNTLSQTAAAWSFQTAQATAPAGAVYAQISLWCANTMTAKFDAIVFRLVRSMNDETRDDGNYFRKKYAANRLASSMIANASFEDFPDNQTVADDWTPDYETQGSGWSYAKGGPLGAGTYSQEIINNGASGGTAIASRPFSVKQNHKYNFQWWAWCSVANPGTMYFRVLWFTDSNNPARNSANLIGYNDIVAAGGPTVATTWQAFNGILTAPNGAVCCVVALYNWSGTACTLAFDHIQVQPYLTQTAGIDTNAVTGSAEDRETGAVSLSTASFIVIAKIGAFAVSTVNNQVRFAIHANLSLTNMTLDNTSNQKDSVQWEIVYDQTAAVGAAVSGGSVITGPHPVAINSNNVSAGTCSPQISVVGNPPKVTVGDTNNHSYSLAVKLVNGGAGTISGATVAGSATLPSACLEIHELKR